MRYFYKPQPMRSLEEIRADILALEQEAEGMAVAAEYPPRIFSRNPRGVKEVD